MIEENGLSQIQCWQGGAFSASWVLASPQGRNLNKIHRESILQICEKSAAESKRKKSRAN